MHRRWDSVSSQATLSVLVLSRTAPILPTSEACLDPKQPRTRRQGRGPSRAIVAACDVNPNASQEAKGFPREGFANHVGQRVTVREISSPGGTRSIFKMRGIQMLSDICASQQLLNQPQRGH
jgi:hypothetical protein